MLGKMELRDAKVAELERRIVDLERWFRCRRRGRRGAPPRRGEGSLLPDSERYDLRSPDAGTWYQSVGEALGLSVDTVKNYLTRSREEYRLAVMEIVSEYVDDRADLASEMRDLFGL